ncbi:MAG: elongation factor 1-beta [Promethearchaeati archaeon SRVP18_Atabeyarchaeia-1]
MANVLAIIKVMPESAETNIQKLQSAISKKLPPKVSIKKAEIEEVAFGIKALKLSLMLPDETGGTDSVEEAIRNVKGVSDVQIEFCSRL